jgi:DNA polymerase-3 subunit delta
MHALEFLKMGSSSGKAARPVAAVVGDDAYLRREVVTALVRAALGDGAEADDMAVSRFPGEHAGLADVMDELRTLPFLVRRRIVVIENADPFVTAHRRELETYVERPATGLLILLVKTWPATTRLAKLVSQHGQTIDCKAPKEAELPDWLVRLAKDHEKAVLEPDAARTLVELVGPEFGLLAGEVAKLAVFVGERARITREDVMRLVGAGRVETIWRVLDAAASGRAPEALDLVDRLLTSGEHPVGLLAAMSASLRKLHHAGQLRANRVELKEACAAAGILAFAVEQTRRQHAHLGPSRVDQLPAWLLRADIDLKGGSALEPRVVIERFLLALAGPRSD